MTARKIKATPARISSIIIHSTDGDSEPQRALLGVSAGPAGVGEAAPGPQSRHDVGGDYIGSAMSS